MLFRAKPDSPGSPPAIFFISSRKNSRDDVLPGATYFCIFCRRPYAIGNACVFHQMRMELYHQDRVDRVPIADRLKNEPVSQCSSNMQSVAPKESNVLSIKYQNFSSFLA